MTVRIVVLLGLLIGSAVMEGQVPEADAEGCKDSALMKRMPGCMIEECSKKEFEGFEFQVGGTQNEPKMKTVEGEVETIRYSCPMQLSALQIARNVEGALKGAKFSVLYSGKSQQDNYLVTGNGGGQWLTVDAYREVHAYLQTTVREKAMAQELELSADAMAEAINKSGRVAIYGIQFDTGKATLKAESAAALEQVLALMQGNEGWKFRVEGHTDNVGAKAANQALSMQRAAAVVEWLAGKGIAKARLTAQGFGDSKPVGDNATDEGKAKNRRVELVKL